MQSTTTQTTRKTKPTRKPNTIVIDDDRGVATIICTDRHGHETGRTLIDAEDVSRVRAYRWHCWRTITPGSKRQSRGRRYVATNIAGKRVSLHRFILCDPPAPGMVPDHISGNGLDNRKRNLRWLSYSENSLNKTHTPGASGFVGVTWYRDKKRWAAEVWRNRRRAYRSYHRDRIEAAHARDTAALRIQGPLAHLNFGEGSGR